MIYRVVFSPGGNRSRARLEQYLAKRFSVEGAYRFCDEMLIFCSDLQTFPHRGTPRPELGQGMRIVGFKDRVSVLFRVSESDGTVTILNFFYGGRLPRI